MAYDHIEAYILAGGKAGRMNGINKAMILVDGKPIIERLLDVLSPHMPVTIISNNPAGMEYLSVPIISDLQKGLGPIGGLETGLANSKRPFSLFVPCDVPRINWDLLRPLVEGCKGYEVVMYKHQYYEPLVAVYAKSCLSYVRRVIKEGRARPIRLLEFVKANVLPIDQRESFMNLNTPDDLAEFEKKK